MTPQLAGEMCDRLDRALRGSETNLSALSNMIVVVIRDELWKERAIRTGEVVRCESFLEMLTAEPLRGFGPATAKTLPTGHKADSTSVSVKTRRSERPKGH